MHIRTQQFVEWLNEMVEAGGLTKEEAERLREADAILERLENGEPPASTGVTGARSAAGASSPAVGRVSAPSPTTV